MANQVAALLKGEDFQHLYSWLHILELKIPKKQVVMVRIEDPDAVSADDVTVLHAPASYLADRFHQIKYHVDQAGAYSVEQLTTRPKSGSSLLEKLYRSWKAIHDRDPSRPIEIHLVSNWSWDSADKVKTCFNGQDSALTDLFFDATPGSDVGRLRGEMHNHLAASPSEFSAFCRELRFKLGFDCWGELAANVAERMDWLGLKSDPTALLVAVGIVREWIKVRRVDIDIPTLDAVLRAHDLYAPAPVQPAVHVHLVTIKHQAFDIQADHVIDWRDRFLGSDAKRGHQLINPDDWNSVLLPQLEALETEVNRQPIRLIRVRGKARLSAWFAFGHVFSETNGYTIEVDQGAALWRSDAPPSSTFSMVVAGGDPAGETLRDPTPTIAAAISVTASLGDDVRADVRVRQDPVSALLLLRPDREVAPRCITSASDATAFAEQTKALLREFVRKRGAKRLLLYYCGCLAGACFLGHRLNAVCPEIQVMEYDQQEPGYHESFLLK